MKLIGKCYKQTYVLFVGSLDDCINTYNLIKNGLINNDPKTKLKYNHLTGLYINEDYKWERNEK